MTNIAKTAAMAAVIAAVGLLIALWEKSDPKRSEADKIVVVDRGISTPRLSPAPVPIQSTENRSLAGAQEDIFSNSFAPQMEAEEFDWQNSSTATQGFSDRTGPPTLAGGGFNASPDEKPTNGETLEIP